MPRYLEPLRAGRKRRVHSGKTASLRALAGMGLAVPKAFICSSKAHAQYDRPRRRAALLSGIRKELSTFLDPDRAYAVRSAAALEDSPHTSMAGQYQSLLRICGVEPVLNAIQAVWTSARRAGRAYRLQQGGRPSADRLEVLIQEMVDAVCSGASFSRNPVTGADEVIVEAVEGTSEAFLQHGATPKRWVITGEEATSDWSTLPNVILQEIVSTTRRAAKELGYPADLEWAYDGQRLWWLQARPITSLHGLPVYSNRISREYLPGLVLPLVWSINVPMINGAWVDLFERLVGPLSLDPLSLAKQFSYRAYFNMSGMGSLFRRLGLPENALEQLLGLVPIEGRSPFGFRVKMLQHLPRLIRFLPSVLWFHRAVPRWERRMRLQCEQAKEALAAAQSLEALVAWADRFLPLMRHAAQQRILSLLLHLVAGQLGHRALKHRGIEEASALHIADPRLEAYDPTPHIGRLAADLRTLPPDVHDKARAVSFDAFFRLEATQVVRGRFDEFIRRFGYLSESGNDFSAPAWREKPTGILRLAADFELAAAGDPASAPVAVRSRRVRRWARRVSTRRLDRERVGAIFSQGVHLLRRWALRVGALLEAEQDVADSSDVFLLSLDELRDLSRGHCEAATLRREIAKRKSDMTHAASVHLPDLILGDYTGETIDKGAPSKELRGIPASRGITEGTAHAVRSLDQTSAFGPGDVLVVPFSDIAWTPLFARAGAIVAEAGGVLSHSSIVAREFRIPAVVSVPDACSLLDGRHVRVNGYEGKITILDPSGRDEPTDSAGPSPASGSPAA